MFKLFFGNYEETILSIFEVYDFDKDGKITAEDTKLLLSHLPLRTKEEKSDYKYQMKSFDDIDEIIKKSFGNRNFLSFTDFCGVIESKATDMYLQLFCFFYQKRPFNEHNINIYQGKKSDTIEVINKEKLLSSPEKKLRSPAVNTVLSPCHELLSKYCSKKSSPEKSPEMKLKGMGTPEISAMKGVIRMPNKLENINQSSADTSSNSLDTIIKQSKNTFDSPSSFLRAKNNPTQKGAENFDITSNLVMMKEFALDSSDDETTEDDKPKIIYESTVYKITEKGNLKKYWLVLIGHDIYYYKNKEKTELDGMHNLSGCFLKDSPEKTYNNEKFYSFGLVFSSKTRVYFTPDKTVLRNWNTHLKKAIGYNSFMDFYELSDVLGEGKFGLVRMGIHKKTQEKVAIKIIKKEKMTNNDLELIKSELDIMKLCQHPNIIRLLDHFENAEYIFLVMELMSGYDLHTYFIKNKFKFSEKQAADISYQIASGLCYLHKYGVLHRDLKPENIMLSDMGESSVVKIMDFGLSKILGPNEKVADGYGTLSFVAPEVLVRQPYNKQIDIWSLGVILYFMLSGELPFDDKNDNEEKIAKMTVFTEVKFPKDKWKNRSNEVIDLITKCLIKKQDKRIAIESFLSHEWITKNVKMNDVK